jgi:PAS domain S-box-containing protein
MSSAMDPVRQPQLAHDGQDGLTDDRVRRVLEDAASTAVIGCDADGRITDWNLGAERILGYSARDIIGADLHDLMRTQGQRAWLRGVLDARRPAPRLHRVDLSRSDGDPVSCLAAGEQVRRDDDGLAIYLLLVPVSRPARLAGDDAGDDRAPRESGQSLDSLSVLAGGIAHDFNNLLLGMVGHADLALMELPADHPVREHVDQIAQAGLRAADLCRQLMSFSGTGVLVKEEIDLSDLVRGLSPLMRMSLGRFSLDLDVADQLPAIEADATQLRQVIMNLVTNAAEAVGDRDEGVVTVRTRCQDTSDSPLYDQFSTTPLPPGDYVIVEVEDNGDGMAPDEMARAFEPFFTTKFTGRGLGLASAYGIVRAHRGSILLCSSPRTGTTATVALPAVRREASPASAPSTPRAAVSSRTAGAPRDALRILVVDDEAHVRTVAASILNRADYEVALADHGGAALDILAADASAVDLVLLDLTMPGLDGLDVLDRIRELRSDLPVVLTSGYGPERTAHVVAGDPNCRFLAKPYRRLTLLEAVEAMLTGHQS